MKIMEFLENVLVIFFSLIILNMMLIRGVGFVLFFWTVGQVLLCPSLQSGQIHAIFPRSQTSSAMEGALFVGKKNR